MALAPHCPDSYPFADRSGEEMRNNQRRTALTVGVVAGGLLGAAFLPMAVAVADQYDFTPDIGSFVPKQVEGYPPLINEVTGTESWQIFDLTTNAQVIGTLNGTDTETTIGSFTNDDYLTDSSLFVTNGTVSVAIPVGTQIDLADFGGGWENEWIDIPSAGTDPGASDLLITPFGDFALFGSFFSDFSSVFG
ncbi:MAG TPA: hypothetical protein VN741_11465 [Mycobacterium sp.]|nr:hypothetical protein [Mycobacterium sp.]